MIAEHWTFVNIFKWLRVQTHVLTWSPLSLMLNENLEPHSNLLDRCVCCKIISHDSCGVVLYDMINYSYCFNWYNIVSYYHILHMMWCSINFICILWYDIVTYETILNIMILNYIIYQYITWYCIMK